MQDQEKKAHAMTTFSLFGALFGGLFGSPREKREPQDYRPSSRK